MRRLVDASRVRIPVPVRSRPRWSRRIPTRIAHGIGHDYAWVFMDSIGNKAVNPKLAESAPNATHQCYRPARSRLLAHLAVAVRAGAGRAGVYRIAADGRAAGPSGGDGTSVHRCASRDRRQEIDGGPFSFLSPLFRFVFVGRLDPRRSVIWARREARPPFRRDAHYGAGKGSTTADRRPPNVRLPSRRTRWSAAPSCRRCYRYHVLRPKLGDGRIGRWLAARLGDPCYRIRLDDIGTIIWKACDGATPLTEMAGGCATHSASGSSRLGSASRGSCG